MSMKRIMGTETEYGISGGHADEVIRAYNGGKSHKNMGKTNESVVPGMSDVGGHIGGDYGTIEEQTAGIGFQSFGIGRKRKKYGSIQERGFTYATPDQTLPNGARFYVDMAHPEYCTPETSNARDLVIADKAGEVIVDKAAKLTGKKVKIFKNNSDGQGNSFGCHENYLMKRVSANDFTEKVFPALLPFFVTRQIFTGSGKIGIEEPTHFSAGWSYGGYSGYGLGLQNWASREEKSDVSSAWKSYEKKRDEVLDGLEGLGRHFLDIPEFKEVQALLMKLSAKREALGEQQVYQLSQRADFFEQLIGLGTTSDRPIVNTRDEPHANSSKYMRLHVISGDANLCEAATYLKAGTMSLLLDMIEDGIAPKIKLRDPVKAIKAISADQTRKWAIPLSDGKMTSALDIQRAYFETALGAYKGRDGITDAVLERWGNTLDALASDPMQLVGKVDWVTKFYVLNHLMDKDGVGLNDDRIKNAALQYHDVDRGTGLFYFVQGKGLTERLVGDDEIENAVSNPPEDTRAYLRGRATSLKGVSDVDWGGFEIKCKGFGKKVVSLDEPFSGTRAQVGNLVEQYKDAKSFVEGLNAVKGISIKEKSFFSTYQPGTVVVSGVGVSSQTNNTGVGKVVSRPKKQRTMFGQWWDGHGIHPNFQQLEGGNDNE